MSVCLSVRPSVCLFVSVHVYVCVHVFSVVCIYTKDGNNSKKVNYRIGGKFRCAKLSR